MKYLGDITQINGADIEPVDCITAGSPCQDLSVAGKRAGLDGERSGLFMEQIRIIKEMRENDRKLGRTDEFIRPRYMVWENVYMDSNGKKKKCSDSARYKALGNSICLPFWFWLLRRISAQYERPAMLGSLFDGIGGFPLCWERCNGIGTARWASEIEEFPIAVTKAHFGDGETEGDIRSFI